MTSAMAPTAHRTCRAEPTSDQRAPVRAAPEAIAAHTVPRLRLLRHEPDPEDPADPAPPRPTPAPEFPVDLRETPELRRRAHHVLCRVLEVLDGRRPLAHLTALLHPPVLRYVRAAAGRPPARRPSRLTSLHVHRPCTGAVEVAAVHRTGDRTRVLAARLEGHPDHPTVWRCVALRLL